MREHPALSPPFAYSKRKSVARQRASAKIGKQLDSCLFDSCARVAATKEILRAKYGEGGIRTLGALARTTVFETVPFDRSGTSPQALTLNPTPS